MTNYVQLTDLTGVGNIVNDATAGDTLTIKQGVVVESSDIPYIFSEGDLDAVIAGTVLAGGYYSNAAIVSGAPIDGLADTGFGSTVTVTQSGAVAGFQALVFYGGYSTVTNAGAISGFRNGVRMDGNNNVVNNSGSITGQVGILNGDDEGVAGIIVTNTGLINGTGYGVQSFGADASIVNSGVISSRGIGVLGGLNMSISNSGTIAGSVAGISGRGGLSVVNSGAISSTNPAATSAATIDIFTTAAQTSSVLNLAGGVISAVGGTAAIRDGDGAVGIVNRGDIVGTIKLAGGNDSYDGTLGTVAGAILGENGNDSIAGGAGRENINGGLGADDLDGGGGNDAFTANNSDGDDTYDGGDGIDRISFAAVTNGGVAVDIAGQTASGIGAGNIGNDTIIGIEQVIGTNLADSFSGDANVNRFFGSNGIDTLFGADGNDFLFGDAGADNIIGGAGRDFLTGGADSDTFRYQAVADSTQLATGRDLIRDFVSDADVVLNPVLIADVINLSAIDADGNAANGNGAFVFIGYAVGAPLAFTGVAGQLRAYSGPTATFIEADVNGDTVADFSIQIFGTHTFAATDFVL